jgi:SpoVK/Ycf46/Vps4 family AAA+-type ATPase
VLNSDRAIEVKIAIMRVFVRSREMMAAHKELAVKLKELEGHLVEEAAREAFRERRPITQGDILSAVAENPPRLDKEKVEKMKRPIGFL